MPARHFALALGLSLVASTGTPKTRPPEVNDLDPRISPDERWVPQLGRLTWADWVSRRYPRL
jgi:hypothetical protein